MNIVDIAIKSLVVAAFGLGLFAFMRRSSAAARHYLLALSLFSLCALPLVAPVLPRWSVPFIRIAAPISAPAPLAVQNVPASGVAASAMNVVPTAHPMDRETASAVLWASIAMLLCLRVFTRLSRLRRMEQSLSMCAQPELQSLVADYCRQHRRHFLLLEGESNEPPMTWGHSRPVLLLPSAAREWPADRLRSVLLHELAHVERGDWIVSLAGELVCAVFWFNPLAWAIRKRLEIESERAADEWVVARGVPRTDYATHLVELLRDLNRYPKAADAAVGIARPSRLDARVRAILVDRKTSSLRGSTSIGLVALISLSVAVIGAAGPTIVRSVSPDESPLLLAQQEPLLEPPAPSVVSAVEHIPARAKKALPTWTRKASAQAADSRTLTAGPVASHASVTKAKPGAATVVALSNGAASEVDASSDSLDNIGPAFDSKKFEASMNKMTDEINRSAAKVERQAERAGDQGVQAALESVSQIDIQGLLSNAMKAAGEGMAAAHLTKEQRNAIQAQIRDSMKQAMRQMPPNAKHGHK